MVVHIDSWVATLFLKYWPKGLGYIEVIRVGTDTCSFVKIRWF